MRIEHLVPAAALLAGVADAAPQGLGLDRVSRHTIQDHHYIRMIDLLYSSARLTDHFDHVAHVGQCHRQPRE
jgi:hypothetical protein